MNLDVGIEITKATPDPYYAMAPIPRLAVLDDWFPWALRRVVMRCRVTVSAEIDVEGRVTWMKVVHADNPELRDVTVKRFEQLRFWPARDGNRAVPAHIVAEITFAADDS